MDPDFFLVVATKSLMDPTDEFITLEDFLETWMWFDPGEQNILSLVHHELDEPVACNMDN